MNRIAKKCSQCGVYKLLTDFHRRRASADGRQSICRACKQAGKLSTADRKEKRCRICGKMKPLEAFHRRKSSPDGRQYDCKECLANPPQTSSATSTEDEIREEQAKRLAQSIVREHGLEIPPGNWTWEEIIGMFPVCCICGKRKPLTEYETHGIIRTTTCKECER
jgi:hypothetical protein